MLASVRSQSNAPIRTYTQEDPIGLGGLNLYGFAGGNPVNFSDPFGLCPDEMRSDAEECETWNQEQAALSAAYFNDRRAKGNPGGRAVARDLRAVRGVNSEDLMLQGNCGGGDVTATGCTRLNGEGAVIVVNADRPVPAIATTLAHETVHAAGLGMQWEGYAQSAAWVFVKHLPLDDRITAEVAGAGPRPTRLIMPIVCLLAP